MAGCYHDHQDFTSDLKIEVAREGDLLKEGQDLKDITCICKKNPGHRGFIPFKDLTLEHLPINDRNRKTFDKIKNIGSLVVRLVVDKKRNGRLIREVGTGSVYKFEDEYIIKTNNHVVKTDDEVKHCTVEFHYDDDSRSSVLTSTGVRLSYTCPYRDITLFTFNPVPHFLHQHDWGDDDDLNQPSIVIMYKNNHIETLDTRHHLRSPSCSLLSLLTSGDNLNLNSSQIKLMFISHPDGSCSYLKSSFFTFQPMPSNVQHLTSIDVHIDEDDGNSRVIPGNVVKFGDEFVVKISECIFQDEVKKCKLVWNGEDVGCGIRLYFEQVDVRELYSGIDLEDRIEQGRVNFWIFDIYPIPRYLEDSLQSELSNHIYCIGHPHGGIKMVTFGRPLERSTIRFDNMYRRITKPDKDCQCREVVCIKYSCKTCPGSSGSPILILFKGVDSDYSLTHFMGESVKRFLPNGEMIENINIAWAPIKPRKI